MSASDHRNASAASEDWWSLTPSVVALLSPLLCLAVIRFAVPGADGSVFMAAGLTIVLVFVTLPAAFAGMNWLLRFLDERCPRKNDRIALAVRALFVFYALAVIGAALHVFGG